MACEYKFLLIEAPAYEKFSGTQIKPVISIAEQNNPSGLRDVYAQLMLFLDYHKIFSTPKHYG
jgi:hypothetical protein